MNCFRKLVSTWLLVVVPGILLLTSCGSSSKTQLRVVHAAPNEGNIDILVDTNSFATNLAYGADTGYLSISTGSRRVQIEPTGISSPFFDSTLSFNGGTATTIVATGPGTPGMVLTDDNSKPTSGNFKLRIVDAELTLGAMDIYIVDPSTDINTVSPTIAGLNPQSASAYQSLAAASEKIVITPAGSKFVYLDSGSVAFSTGQIRTVVILDNLSGGLQLSTLADAN